MEQHGHIFFFYSFYIISLIIFNLLVGIVINHSTKIQKCEESSINIYQLNDIQNVWSEFDKNGISYINYKTFGYFYVEFLYNAS